MKQHRAFLVVVENDSLEADWIHDTLIVEQGKNYADLMVFPVRSDWIIGTVIADGVEYPIAGA